MVVIDEEMGVRGLLKDTGIFKEVDGGITLDYRIDEKMVETDDEKRAYIRGAFLGGGSVTNPEKTIILNLLLIVKNMHRICVELINSCGLNSKVIQRKNSFYCLYKRRRANCGYIKHNGSSFLSFRT